MPNSSALNSTPIAGLKVARHIKLYQPWARIVCEGTIPVLIRPYSTRVREWVGVITASKFDPQTQIDSPVSFSEFPLGQVIGAIRIDDVKTISSRSSVRRAIARRFGRTLAEFYPRHYVPDTSHHRFMWIIGAAFLTLHPTKPPIWTGRGWCHFSHEFRD